MTGQQLGGYYPGVVGEIVKWHGSYYNEFHGLDITFEAQVSRDLGLFIGALDPAREGLWTMRCGDAFAGSIAVQRENGDARLRWFIVPPALACQGTGRILLDAALGFCRDHDYKRVFLWTFKGLDAARHSYERSGFRLAEEALATQWGRRDILEQKFVLDIP